MVSRAVSFECRAATVGSTTLVLSGKAMTGILERPLMTLAWVGSVFNGLKVDVVVVHARAVEQLLGATAVAAPLVHPTS